MGHKEKPTKVEVQKARLKNVFINLLETEISLMLLHKTLTSDEKALKIVAHKIQQAKKSIRIINEIQHIEILQSLYNSFLGGKEVFFAYIPATLLANNNVKRWDTSEKGFQEFLKLDAEAKAKSKQEYEERLKQQELLKKAQEQGKKVEYVMKDGKMQPFIVEDKPN